MKFKNIFISFALLGIVIYGMMSFIITIQDKNSAPEMITSNPLINQTYASLTASLNDSQNVGNEQNSIFGQIKPTESYGEVEIDSIVAPTKAFKAIVLGIYNVLIKLPSSILGISEIVTGVISAILIMLLILGIWAVWKGVF